MDRELKLKYDRLRKDSDQSDAISLLMELGPDIGNFSDKFKGKVQNTYVLTPGGSDLFSISIHNNELYLGAPEIFMPLIRNVSWDSASYIPGKPGLFLVFYLGPNSAQKRAAIRIGMRSRTLEIMKQFDDLHILGMEANGRALPPTSRNLCTVPVKSVGSLVWESA